MTDNNTLLTLEINSNILQAASEVFAEKGLSLNEAITGYLDASVFCNDIPYDFVIQEPDFPPDEEMIAPDFNEPENEQMTDNELPDFIFDDVEVDEPITYIIRVVFDDDNAIWRAHCDEIPEFHLECGSFDALVEKCKTVFPTILAIKEIPSCESQIVFWAERQEMITYF